MEYASIPVKIANALRAVLGVKISSKEMEQFVQMHYDCCDFLKIFIEV